MLRFNSRKIVSLALTLASACLFGGADDCFGGSDAPVSVGDAEDMGTGDMGTAPTDAATPIDMATPFDMSVPVDMHITPVDAGPPTGAWSVASIGYTDDDVVITLRVDALGEKHVAHFGEAGFGYYDHTEAGVWQPQVRFYRGMAFGTGCEIIDGMDVDAEGRAHIVYRVPETECTTSPSYDQPSRIHYVVIDGSSVGTNLLLETVARGSVQPFVAVDAGGTAHVVYGSADNTHTRYVSVTAGVASTPIDIPGLGAWPMDMAMQSTGPVVAWRNSTGLGLIAKSGGTWGAPLTVAPTGTSISVAIDSANRAHVAIDVDDDTWAYGVVDAPLAAPGVVTEHMLPEYAGATPSVWGIAISPTTSQAAIVVSYFGTGPAVLSSDGTLWGTEPYFSGPSSPQQCTPSIAFEADGTANVAFQGWGADDLYLATFH